MSRWRSVRPAARAMWQRTPAPKRGEILYAFGALMAQHKERLARAMTREMGKVLSEARGDVQEGIDIAFLMAGEGRRMFGDTTPSELPDKWAMSIRQPIGVAALSDRGQWARRLFHGGGPHHRAGQGVGGAEG